MAENTKSISKKKQLIGIARVAKISFQTSPLTAVVKIVGAVINAVLPIITTYFAALTTTALAEAYAGDHTAGSRALFFVIVTVLLGIMMNMWTSVSQYVDTMASYKIKSAISDRLYAHFLRLEYWRYDDKNTNDLFDKSKRFVGFFGYIFNSVTTIATALISLVASLGALFFVSWQIGLIVLVAVIPGVLIQLNLSRFRAKHWSENIETRRRMDEIEWNMLQPARIVELRLYGLVQHLLDLRVVLRDKDEKVRIEYERKIIGKQLASDILEAAAEIIALVSITMKIIAHAQPIGQFLYVQQLVSRTLAAVHQSVTGVGLVDEDIANLFDYDEFMKLEEATARPVVLEHQPNQLRAENVSFHYPQNDAMVLKNISLTIEKGQKVAFVGENGAGKSTLIKLLLGIYQPSNGVVLVDNDDLAKVSYESWHKYIGVLQQSYGIYSFATAWENIAFGDVTKRASKQHIEAAAHDAEAADFLQKLPKGYDSYVTPLMEHDDGTKGTWLSGGQEQRLSLARNFYRDSPIVILDEPTSAIDALAESRIFRRLFTEKDKTIITVSHRLSTVKKADVIYVLEDGKIVEQGAHDELVRKKGAYYTLFESQL